MVDVFALAEFDRQGFSTSFLIGSRFVAFKAYIIPDFRLMFLRLITLHAATDKRTVAALWVENEYVRSRNHYGLMLLPDYTCLNQSN